jgi:putative membrane protein
VALKGAPQRRREPSTATEPSEETTMYWYGDHVSGWGWLLMGVGMVTFWGVVLTGAVLLAHSLARPQQPPTPFPPTATPEQLLAQRFAQGEIDEAEYRDRLATLRSHASRHPCQAFRTESQSTTSEV